jgi:FkbM family methyltransferase
MFKKQIQQKLQGIQACALGSSIVDKLLLIAYYIGVRVNRKLGKAYFTSPRQVSITYRNLSFKYTIGNLDDYRILEEMYIDKQYTLNLKGEVRTIVDIGSNVGTSIIYFLANYHQAKIYGFEPTTYCYELLKRTVGGYDRVTIEKKAIGIHDGQEAPIYIHPAGHSGSSNFFIEGSKKEQVPTITLDAIIEKYHLDSIDILKMDIEGLEYEVFQSFKHLSLVKYILVEIHPFVSGHSKEDFLALFPLFEILEIIPNPFSSKTILVKLKRR